MADLPRVIGRRTILWGLFALCVPVTSAPLAGQVSPAAERRAVDRADGLFAADRPEEARSILVDLLERTPASVDALDLLHRISVDDGEFDDALARSEAAAAANPSLGRVREIWVRVLVDAGIPDSARAVARRWVEMDGADERAVLALAEALVAAGESGEAEDELRRAVERGSGTRMIRLRRADLLVESGDVDEATDIWVDLLASEDPAVDAVVEDIRAVQDPTAALERFVDQLDEPNTPAGPGSLVALRFGRSVGARRLADRVSGDERAPFLREYVRESDLAGLPQEVAWAAQELVILSPRPVDKLRWQAMVADRSLAAGDTTTARGAFEALTRDTDPGAGPHDAATRRLFSLLAADPTNLGEARAVLDRHAAAYPDSLRVRAAMYGELAEGHARGGDLARAAEVVGEGRAAVAGGEAGTGGALDASAGRLAFWGGEQDSAIVRVQRSLGEPGLGAAALTARIELLTAVQAADSTEIVAAGAAAFGLHRDPSGFDLSPSLRELAGSPASTGRATVLAYLATQAVRAGRRETAVSLWRRVVEVYPASAETPAALLGLARHSSTGEATGWLEQLIVGYPESALAPVARRMLAELDEGA